MRLTSSVFALVMILSLIAFAPACKKKSPEVTPVPEVEVYEPAPPPTEPEKIEVKEDTIEPFVEEQPTSRDIAQRLNDQLRTIYFGFDSSELSASARSTLRENSELLKAYADHGVVVQGHCDERGTIEYNLALGEHRASSVRDYLVSLGISRSRVRIITFGEERPVDPGHTEASWSQNRRAAFKAE